MEKKKIVFLYTEIAEYFLACCKALLDDGVEVHIVRYPLNKEAPFQFNFSDKIKVYERNKLNDEQLLDLVNQINPSIIVCSGWIDKGYLKVCKKWKSNIPTVLTIDNQWRGTIKQQIARLISPFFLLNRFSYCWVPGILQKQYAVKLGFNVEHILTGFYSCDFAFFYKQYLQNKEEKTKQIPKRFIYVGRYYEFKGIKNLWRAFIELQEEKTNDWELWCLGTGDIEPIVHPKIKHFGFVQPSELSKYLKDTGVFVLPSFFEPWGVVVHEFASAGFPIICSDKVGAKTALVENNFNGYIYNSQDIRELKSVLLSIMKASNSDLVQMAHNSVLKAKQITPELWSKQILSLIA